MAIIGFWVHHVPMLAINYVPTNSRIHVALMLGIELIDYGITFGSTCDLSSIQASSNSTNGKQC
jgi:hypothetical protein